MAERIPQSTTIRTAFVAYLSTDHLSPATGKTIPITISKNGAAFGNPSGGATNATEIANGCYYVDLSTTDTGTVGPLFVYGSLAGVDTILFLYDVISTTAVSAGVNVVNWNGTVVATPATGGIPDVNLINWRNVQPLALNSNEVQVAPDWSNILNATSTTALTNTTIKNVTGTPPDSAGVTTLLLRIASALSISAGAVTVGTVASGAIAAASFAANALDAVWSTPARTLTAFSFTVNAALTQILGTALTETTTGWLAAAFRKFFNLAAPTSTMNEITLVDTTTTLTNAPVITDPLLNVVPGSYAVGTAGYDIGQTYAKVNTIGAGSVTVVSPVSGNTNITVAQATDNLYADGLAPLFTLNGWPDIIDGTVTLSVEQLALTVSGVILSGTQFYFDLTRTDTNVALSTYNLVIKVTLANGHVMKPIYGIFGVTP